METSASEKCSGCKRVCRPFIFVWDVLWFFWQLVYLVVVTPFIIVWSIITTLITLVATHLPLILFLGATIAFTIAFVDQEKVIVQKVEVAWRCTIVPLFLAPLPTGLRNLIEPYEAGICYYNALAFTNRILSKKSVTEILAEDPNKLSTFHPVLYVIRGIFEAFARIGRWLLSFYNARFPVYALLNNAYTYVVEILLRLINALCRDLHSPFFYFGRVITQERFYCAIDNAVNSVIARYQYWITFIWDLVITILSLLGGGFITNFDGFVDNFRTQISDVSPVLNIPSERMAMASIHVGEGLNEAIHSLICTIVTEVELYTQDSTLVNGTIPPSHTSYPLASNETYLNETVYAQCMANASLPYYYNLFGPFGHLGAAFPRYLFVMERIYPSNLFRIAWEFFTLSGPVSDDGSLGYDINTPIPNNSTRFLMSAVPIDAIWDTFRRPLDTLRQSSTLERWPYKPLYGIHSDLYDPMENTTTTCGNASYGAPPYQENLFCKECKYNRTEANVVSQIEILARNLDDLLEPYLERRLFRPLLFEIGGGLVRVGVAGLKWLFDNPRHIASGFDEAIIFYARMNYYDVIFDEIAGKPHELGGVFNGTVNFFAAIYPSLHIVPKWVILPGKVVVEFVRNIVRLVPILLNTLIGIGGEPTYGPRISEFFCLDGSPNTCINVEEQFFKWLRIPRNVSEIQFNINSLRRTMPNTGVKVFDLGISTVDRVRINQVFDEVANNYTNLLYGDVYDPNAMVLPYQFGWLECFRYFLSPSFVNSFIPNPVDHITTSQFPDITCSVYYTARAVVEASKASYELVIAILQTIFDLFSNTNPNMPAVLFRWLACTDSNLCVPLLEMVSDAQDFVQCPCHFLGDSFLDVPCLCNVTNSLGLGAVDIIRASINVELATSQLIVCITEFPGGATNTTSKGCYAIVSDRVIDIFTKIDNATSDVANFGSGLGCVIGLMDTIPCGTSFADKLSHFTSDMGYYAVQFVLSIVRSVLGIVQSFFVYLKNVVLGYASGPNPATGFSVRYVVERVLNETITPLVGDPNNSSTHGLIQSLGRVFSCLFGTTTCVVMDDNNALCPGWFLVKLGNALRDIYLCLIKMIGNYIGFFEDLIQGKDVINDILGFFDGLACLIAQLITNIVKIVLGIIGGFLDTIFQTGTTITDFLKNVADTIDTVIGILGGLFWDIGEAFDCSGCWTGCLSGLVDGPGTLEFPPIQPDDCERCYCKCKCQRPTLPGYICRWNYDGNNGIEQNEDWTPVNPAIPIDCPARDAAANLYVQRTTCWAGCLARQGFSGSISSLVVAPPQVCSSCYCECMVQPSPDGIAILAGVDVSACYRDWDNSSVIEGNETFTSSGSMAITSYPYQLSYSCAAARNSSQLLECVSCWWHYLNATMVVNQLQYTSNSSFFFPAGLNVTTRYDTTATNTQCLGGWCTCQCQYPILLNNLLQYNVDIFDQLLPILSTIDLNDIMTNQTNFTLIITQKATQNYTITPTQIDFTTTINQFSGEYWWYTGFHGYCQKDWDNNGINATNRVPTINSIETYTPNTPYGKCPGEVTNELCQVCWFNYYNLLSLDTVYPDYTYTSDTECYNGWCLCQCNPTDAIHSLLYGNPTVLRSNCTRDWDNDGKVEVFQYPDFLLEDPNASNPDEFPTCTVDYECAHCWHQALVAANPGSTFNSSTCVDGWCQCQCQYPTLLNGLLFQAWNMTFSITACKLDWDGNGTISTAETFNWVNCSAKKRTTLAISDDTTGVPIWEAYLQRQLEAQPLLGELFNLVPTIAVANTSLLQSGAANLPELQHWYQNQELSSELVAYYLDQQRPTTTTPALGEAQNIYTSLSSFVKHNSQELQKRVAQGVIASASASSSSNLCASYLTDIFNTYQNDPSKFESTDKLLSDKSHVDKAFFMGCYTLMVAPSLFNGRSGGSILSLPKYLFMDNQNLKYWLQTGLQTVQTYVQWRMQSANVEVSPALLTGLVALHRNQSLLTFNQTLLAVRNTESYLKRFGALMKRTVNNEVDSSLMSANVPSFADALILGGVTPNPNLRVFAEQLDYYVSSGYTTQRVGQQLARTIQIAQKSTLFDGIIDTLQNMQNSLQGFNPVVWGKMMQAAAKTAAASATTGRMSVKMITSAFATGTGDNKTIVPTSDYYGPYGNRNNPIFKVFSGVTLADKLANAAGFYGRVWNHFKSTEYTTINAKIKAGVSQFTQKMAKADGLLRTVETYQFISEKLGDSLNLPKINPIITNMVAQIRTKQQVSSVSSLSLGQVGHMDLIGNGTCNVTRCFECALLINVINDVYDNFQFCTNLSQGIDSIRRFNATTITDPNLVVPELVSNNFLWGLGSVLNKLALFVTSLNTDPFTRTEEPLGLWFYFSTYAPIPYIGYCDRDIHTTCQSGLGFGWGLLIVLLITLGLFVLWFFVPALAGVTLSVIGILGYIIFAVGLLTALSWGMNALCLQTPGISLITLVSPVQIQLPILAQCAVRDISETVDLIVQPCFDFMKYLLESPVTPLICPLCPNELDAIDCNAKGYKSILDVYAYGLNWALWKLGIQGDGGRLISMNTNLILTNSDHQRCFWILFLPSSPFLVAFAIVALLYLYTLIKDIISQLYLAFMALAQAKLFTRK